MTTDEGAARLKGVYTVTRFSPGAGLEPEAPSALEADGTWRVEWDTGGQAALRGSVSLLGFPESCTLTVRSGPPGARLSVSFGAHFQHFYRDLGVLGDGETTFTFPVPPEGYRYGGGEADGTVRLPLRLMALSLRRGDSEAAPVDVVLGPLTCQTRYNPGEAVMLFARIDASDGQRASAVARACNLSGQEVSGRLAVAVRSWDGQLLAEHAAEWTVPPGGEFIERAFDIDIPAHLNFADAAFTFESAGGDRAEALAGYTRPVEDPADTQPRPESPWGMGLYLYRYPQTPEGQARMRQAAGLAARAGVKWSREEIMWSRVEQEEGRFDYAHYDTVVDTALDHGISIYGLLTYWGRFTEPYTPRGIQDYCDFARRTVRRFKDRIHHWEVWNEPNIFFWQGPKDMYPELLKAAHAAIKEEDPDALVLGVSTCGIDPAFTQMCLEADAPFDILTVHPYRPSFHEADLLNDFWMITDIAGGRPVWLTEMGWSTNVGYADPTAGPPGVTEREQAQLLARVYLTSVLSECCQNVSWYNFRCDGADPCYNEHNFGALAHDMTPRPAYRALATVCRSLATGTPRRREDFGESVFALEAGDTLALWCITEPRTFSCIATGDTPQAINLMGEPVPVAHAEGRVTVTLQPACPVFLTGGPFTQPAG
jgi:hypothetical protein